jgi:hypothetical protein
MERQARPETPSLKWIHRIRQHQYRKTKGLPLETWLRPADAEKVAKSLRRLGLKVKDPSRKQAVPSAVSRRGGQY